VPLPQTRIPVIGKGNEKKIGSYFRRNYEEGMPLQIPSDNKGSWNEWKEGKLRKLGYYEDALPRYNMRKQPFDNPATHPPRIYLRGDAPIKKFDWKDELDPHHFEFKVWLQNKIEQANLGYSSPRVLGKRRETERARAMETWDELTYQLIDKFREDFFQLSSINDGYAPRAPRHLLLIWKYEARYRRDFQAHPDDFWIYPDESTITNPVRSDSYDLLEKICREIIRVLIGKSRDIENVDEVSGLKSVQISTPGMTFLEHLQKKICNIIDKAIESSMKQWGEEDPKKKEGNLAFRGWNKSSKWSEKELMDQIKNQGFGNIGNSTKLKNMDKTQRTEFNSIKFAYNILNLLIKWEFIEVNDMKMKEYLDHYHDGAGELEKPRPAYLKMPKNLCLSKKIQDEIGEDNPIYRWLRGDQDRWMYCPPEMHKYTKPEPNPGGLLIGENRKLVGGSHAIYAEFETKRCELSENLIDTLNKLQETQWEINLHFISKLFDIQLITDENEEILLGENAWMKKDGRIKEIKPKEEFEDVYTPKNFEGQIDKQSLDNRNLVMRWVQRIIDHNANVFWHSWTCDFRGRMYPRGFKLSPQGDDLDRALIRFKHWKPLGDEGIYWLRVHVCNMMDGVKLPNDKYPSLKDPKERKNTTFDDKSNWVKSNLKELCRMVNNLEDKDVQALLELDKYRSGKSEAFQRISALIELDRVYQEFEDKETGGDWNEIKSGQPVYLDASCNGYQHVSALLRDKELANLVNITQPGNNDLYEKVAENADTEEAREIVVDFVGEDLADEALGRIFSRKTAKMPTMTRVYGSKDIFKALSGKNGRGKPRFFKVSFELDEEQENDLAGIPPSVKKAYEKWMSESDEVEAKLLKKKFLKKGKKKARYWEKLLSHEKYLPLWAEGSSLHVTLIRDSGNEISEKFSVDLGTDKEKEKKARNQVKLTNAVGKSLRKSVDEVTNGAFDKIEKPLRLIVGKMTMKFPGTEWKLPDGFKARNYYIKPIIDSETSAGSPTHPGSVYSCLLPDWYSKAPSKKFPDRPHGAQKSALRISNRIIDLWKDRSEILGDVELSKAMRSKNRLSNAQMVRILHLIDPEKKDKLANEIRPLIHHAQYSFKRYDEVRKKREKLKKSAIAPNFVHSLDAYHMRTSVRELSESIDQLSFWAVHDAFGTHPCDVPEMSRVVKEEFLKMYEDKNFRYWLDEMVAYQDHRGKRKWKVDFDKDLLIPDTTFNNIPVNDKNGEIGLKTMCRGEGLPESGNREDRVNRLKEYFAEQEGKTVQEKYPDKKLKGIWDESASDLDISKVADAEYMIS
jgi:hypothetical protein